MKKFEIISTCISNAVRRSDLNPNNLNDKGAIGRSTATKIRDGKIVTPNSYFKLMKWLEKRNRRFTVSIRRNAPFTL